MQKWKIAAASLLAVAMAGLSQPAGAGVDIVVRVAPPVIPVYVQPAIPGPGFIWTPGYWAYGDSDYYWVPGTWVRPPRVGLLWTPGYWGWNNGVYAWRAGYWGPRVGFYGGVNYGFGYVGTGYHGGYWQGGVFRYNSTVNNVTKISVTNVYNKSIPTGAKATSASFHGGPGGNSVKPTAEQLSAAKTGTLPPTHQQNQLMKTASTDKNMRASANGGKPQTTAVSRPGQFKANGLAGKAQNGKGLAGKGQEGKGQANAKRMVKRAGANGGPMANGGANNANRAMRRAPGGGRQHGGPAGHRG